MLKTISRLIILISICCISNNAYAIAPFTTDGCSAFPDGTFKQKQLWLSCCVQHDIKYWMGGTQAQRLKADQALKSCVEKTGEKAIAKLMLAGVRLDGSAHFPTSFRWGYGWNYDRGYQVLNKKQQAKVNSLLEAYSQPN